MKSRLKIEYTELSRIYIASPYSYHSKIPLIGKLIERIVRNKREKQVSMITARLLESQYCSFAPIGAITQSHRLAKFMQRKETGFNKWRDIDFSLIQMCDLVCVIKLDGWKESQGVQEEIKFAEQQKIPVFYIDKLFTANGRASYYEHSQ